MTTRIPLISGDEQDALTQARHWYNWRPGIRKAIKKAYNKRFRRYGRKISLDNPE